VEVGLKVEIKGKYLDELALDLLESLLVPLVF